MTAAIHLVRNPLKPLERDSYVVPDGTRIIDWLQEVAPNGFGMPISLFVNQEPLEVIHSDRELRRGDVCACLVTPGYTFGTILAAAAPYIINAAISIAVGLAINALFAPRPPKAQRGPNPVYDIGANNNQARLGEPVPVIYGEVVTTPDFASTPYTFYSAAGDDQQFVDQLFCVGVGEFEEITADDILIGDTPASLFPAGVFVFKQFHLGAATGNIQSHAGQFGTIESDLWSTGDFGADEFKFFENVYTAPDVTDWEFRDDITNVQTSTNYSVDIALTGNEYQGRKEIEVRIQSDTGLSAGSVFTISGTAFDGLYQATRLELDTSTASGTPPDIDYTHVFLYCLAPVGVTPTAGPATITVLRNEVNSQARTGWYAAQPLGQTVRTIRMDMVAPGGLYKVKSNSGTRVHLPDAYKPKVRFEAQEINPATGAILNDASPGSGFSLEYVFNMTDNSPDPHRRTAGFRDVDVVTVPSGLTAADWRDRAYVVRATAEHQFLDNDRYQQRVLWTALKGILSWPSPNQAYGDVTLLAVRMRGTNGISSQAQQQLRVRCRRKYDLLDGSNGASGNPVDVINDIYRNSSHGFGRPADEVNDTFLTDVRGLWEAEGVEFNGVFLQDITGWEALETALLPAVAKPAIDAGQLTVVADKKKPVTMFVFNDMSIVRDSYAGTFSIDNSQETDGIEVEYRDAQTFDPAFVRYPVASSNPQRLVYIGVTDGTYAAQLAQLFWNRRLYQRHTASFQTEMQGMVPMVGDKISVSSPVIRSGESGRVVSIIDTQVVLDKRVKWGANAEISFTKADQSPTAWYAVTEGDEPNQTVLATPVVEDLDMSMLRTPTSYHFRTDA
ncbi:MAG: host specificity factor TipJ family phage tail protein, partial [Halieaceae bacterium]|nr:host specificity factor TipJ family phage tail protein [Halieaceae bacterium]